MKFPLNFIRKEYSNQSLSHCFTSVAIVIIAVNFCSVSTNRPWSQYNIEITQYLCDFDNRTFEDGNCTLKTIGGTQAMSVDAEIRPNVSVNSIFIKFSMQREQKKTLVPFMGLRNVTIDVCKLLRGVHDSIIVNVFLGHLQPKTNLWHPCPYTGHFWMKDYMIDDSTYPPGIPAGTYRFDFIVVTRINQKDQILGVFVMIAKFSQKSYKYGRK